MNFNRWTMGSAARTGILVLFALNLVTVGCAPQSSEGRGGTLPANPKFAALSEDDCKALGGTVSNDTTCESGRVCTTHIIESTGSQSTHTRCVAKQ